MDTPVVPATPEAVPTCWMCDTTSAPRAKEHVFPRWLLDRFHASDQLLAPGVRAQAFTALEICTSCNSGWMSGLEVRFRSAAFGTRSGVIPAHTQLVIARWFAKTAVLADAAGKRRARVTPAARHGLKRGLPTGFDVYLSRHADPRRRLEYRLAEDGSAFACAVRLGDLVGVVHFEEPRPRVRREKALLRIGPLQTRRVTWAQLPTVRSVDECLRFDASPNARSR